MQKENGTGKSCRFLETLLNVEDLAEKKIKIYSRLLTDASLASDMEQLSLRHEKRKETLEQLISGKSPKAKNAKGGGETNGEEEGK